MAIDYADVVRLEATAATLAAKVREGADAFETDGNNRLAHSFTDASIKYWTPDDKFSATIPLYTNTSAPTVANVSDALDYLISGGNGVNVVELEDDESVDLIYAEGLEADFTGSGFVAASGVGDVNNAYCEIRMYRRSEIQVAAIVSGSDVNELCGVTDADNKLCVLITQQADGNSAKLTIKNRLGATVNVITSLRYAWL